jgi:hypothetical protein
VKKSAKVLRSPFSPPVWETPSKQKMFEFPHFLETVSLKKMAVCAHTTRLPKK